MSIMKTRQLKGKGSRLMKQEQDPFSTDKFQLAAMKQGLTAHELVRRLKDKADSIPDEVESFKAEKGLFECLAPYIAKKVGTAQTQESSTPQVVIIDFSKMQPLPSPQEKVIHDSSANIISIT